MSIKLQLYLIPLQRKAQRFTNLLSNRCLASFCGTDFGYYPNSDKIEYALLTNERAMRCYYDFVMGRAMKLHGAACELYQFDMFIISFLHEIGHYHTDNDDFSEYWELREQLNQQNISAKSWEEKEEIFNKYHNLPDEIAATDWAISFIIINWEFCKKWNSIFNKELQKFFKRMNIQ